MIRIERVFENPAGEYTMRLEFEKREKETEVILNCLVENETKVVPLLHKTYTGYNPVEILKDIEPQLIDKELWHFKFHLFRQCETITVWVDGEGEYTLHIAEKIKLVDGMEFLTVVLVDDFYDDDVIFNAIRYKDGSVITPENWDRGLVGLEGIDRLYWQDDKGKKYVFDGAYINDKKSKEVFTRVPVTG